MTTATLSDKRIVESSSLACSFLHRGHAYTGNDDPESPNHLFHVTFTGKVVGTSEVKGASLIDMEAVAVSGAGNIGLGAIGDNKLKRKYISVWIAPEPDTITGHHVLKAKRYDFVYPDGKAKNAEAMLFHPTAKRRYIVTKEADRARVYAFPEKLVRYRKNKLRYIGTIKLPYVTDGSFTPDGQYAVFRQKGVQNTVAFVDWSTLRVLDRIPVAYVKQPESISVKWDGKEFIFGSEGERSPLVTKAMPEEYQ
jgi:hypothetical protein